MARARSLYISRHGYGHPTYKTEDGCGGGGGEGAAPYRRQVLAFDVNDILAAKNGSISKRAVAPYAWWVLPGPTNSCGQIAGYQNGGYCFTWNPTTRRMYGAMDYGDTAGSTSGTFLGPLRRHLLLRPLPATSA